MAKTIQQLAKEQGITFAPVGKLSLPKVKKALVNNDIIDKLNALGLTGDARKKKYAELYRAKYGSSQTPEWKEYQAALDARNGKPPPTAAQLAARTNMKTVVAEAKAKGLNIQEHVKNRLTGQKTSNKQYKPKKKPSEAGKRVNAAARRARHAALKAEAEKRVLVVSYQTKPWPAKVKAAM